MLPSSPTQVCFPSALTLCPLGWEWGAARVLREELRQELLAFAQRPGPDVAARWACSRSNMSKCAAMAGADEGALQQREFYPPPVGGRIPRASASPPAVVSNPARPYPVIRSEPKSCLMDVIGPGTKREAGGEALASPQPLRGSDPLPPKSTQASPQQSPSHLRPAAAPAYPAGNLATQTQQHLTQ